MQSDKASIEISSPYEGVVASLPHAPGDVVKVGSTLMKIDVPNGTQQTSDKNTEESPMPLTEETVGRILAPPPVRLLAKQHNVDLSQVTPTGPKNRVTTEDVLNFVNRRTMQQPKHVKSGMHGTENRIAIKGFRKAMLKSMSAALAIPHFHFCDDVDMQSLLTVRSVLASEPQLRPLKFTVLPILVKALSLALSEFPVINSSLNDDHSELILHEDHNIGVAVATDGGLVVPNVKRVQDKTIVEIAQALELLKRDALGNTCKPEDLTGSTITVSNVGSIGGLYATPLITPPQTAIVALGRMRSVLHTPDKINHLADIHKRPMLPISWGADHRVLDGATLVQFSNRWKQLIEQPERLLLCLK